MLTYIIIFIVVGFFLMLILEEELAIGAILVISVIWFFVAGSWAVATFIELVIGYSIAKSIKS